MSKKLWEWCYLKQPVDYADLLRSESIEKGKKMHDTISKRLKELINSGPSLKFIEPSFPMTYYHYTDNVFDMIPEYIKQCDCEMKILKNRSSIEPIAQWHVDSEAEFDKNIIKDLHVICDGPIATGKVEKLQASKPNKNGDVFPNITVEAAKLQMNGRQLRTEKNPANKKYDIDFVNFAFVNNPVDLAAKIKPIVGFSKLQKEISEIQNNLTENKSSQISICSSCNYYNEWIPFDPDYKCYKCKKGL